MLKDVLSAYAESTNRVFQQDRSKTVGGSEIGMCARRVWFNKNNQKHDASYHNSWGAVRRGQLHEDHFFVPALQQRFGDKLLFAGKQQRTMAVGTLSATPDALLIEQPSNALAHFGVKDIGRGRCIVLENKTADPRVALNFAKDEHVYQAQVQMGLFNETTQYKPEYALISVTNASFFDDITEFVVPFDPAVYAQAKQRADMIMTAKSAARIKPEGWISGGSECKYCPYFSTCTALRAPGTQEGTQQLSAMRQFEAEIEDLARSERQAAAACEQASKRQRELQERIKERLREKQLRTIDNARVRVVWSNVKGRPSFDMAGIKAAAEKAGINLSAFETVGEPFDRMTIALKTNDSLVRAESKRAEEEEKENGKRTS